MKSFKIILNFFILISSISVFAESDQENQFQRGDIVYYTNTSVNYEASPQKAMITAMRSNKNFVIELNEEDNGKQYITNTHKSYLYGANKCTNKTDDGSEICTGKNAISFSYGQDAKVLGIGHEGKTVLVLVNDKYVILYSSSLISGWDQESEL